MDQLPPGYVMAPAVVNNAHRKYDVAAAITVMLVVTTVITVARIWSQFRARLIGMEDWAMIPALLLYIGHSIMGVYCNLNGGIGKPLWEVTYGEFQVWYKGLTGTTFLYPAMTGAIRISILFFYYRIFHRVDTPTRWMVRILLVLTAVYIIVYSIMPGFICRPITAVWMLLERTPQKCKSNEWYYLYTVSLYSTSVGFDVILLLMPIYPVWKLQMPRMRRIGAILLFALGTSSCVAASYKLAMFVQQWGRIGDIDPRWATNIFSLLVPPQFDQYGYTFWIPSQVEPTCALIGSSLPALRRIVQPLAVHIQGSYTSWMSTLKITSTTKSSPLSTRSTGTSNAHPGVHHPFSKIGGSNISQHETSSTTRVLEPDIELEELASRDRP